VQAQEAAEITSGIRSVAWISFVLGFTTKGELDI